MWILPFQMVGRRALFYSFARANFPFSMAQDFLPLRKLLDLRVPPFSLGVFEPPASIPSWSTRAEGTPFTLDLMGTTNIYIRRKGE